MFSNIGMGELLVVLIIILLLFGSKRLPDLARGLGQSIKAFKEGMNQSSEKGLEKPKDDADKK
ncbi:MAG: twin-arginine translocase TatA/TatE family subunit [Elusimicrobiota bacterium]